MNEQSTCMSIQDLSVSFNGRLALENINLDVKSGEILVLMGRSGSGKSTLLRCLNALQTPSKGEVLFHDKGSRIKLSSMNAKHRLDLRRTHISMVFQHFALLPWRNVLDNTAFGLEVKGCSKDLRYSKAMESLKLVGLSDSSNLFPSQLSGGMQQRVGIARALATGADILLMDEPFSALDPLNRRDLQNEVMRLQYELGKTIVFVSHDIDEAMLIGHRIAVLEKGHLIQCAPPKEIREKPANADIQRFFAQA